VSAAPRPVSRSFKRTRPASTPCRPADERHLRLDRLEFSAGGSRHGIRGSVGVTPTVALGHPNATFIIIQVKIAGYFDLNHLIDIEPGAPCLPAGRLREWPKAPGNSACRRSEVLRRRQRNHSRLSVPVGGPEVRPRRVADGRHRDFCGKPGAAPEIRQQLGRRHVRRCRTGERQPQSRAGRISRRRRRRPAVFHADRPIRVDVAVPTQRSSATMPSKSTSDLGRPSDAARVQNFRLDLGRRAALLLLLTGSLFIAGNTDNGRAMIENLTGG